jgi:hypothetical protein
MKSAVSYISYYEKELVKIARKKDMCGVICGQITIRMIQYEDVLYLNSGYGWNRYCACRRINGTWKIIHYADLLTKKGGFLTAFFGLGPNFPYFHRWQWLKL